MDSEQGGPPPAAQAAVLVRHRLMVRPTLTPCAPLQPSRARQSLSPLLHGACFELSSLAHSNRAGASQDVPKLLDAAALYGASNGALTRSLLLSAFALCPSLTAGLSAAAAALSASFSDWRARAQAQLAAARSGGSSAAAAAAQLSDSVAYFLDFAASLAVRAGTPT